LHAAEGTTHFIAPQAGSTAFGIRCSDSKAIIWSYELLLESRETICIASIRPDIAFSSESCGSGRNRPIPPPFAYDICYSKLEDAEGFPRQFLQPQDRHPAPARSSHSPLREPPWKKNRPAHPPGGNVSTAQPVAPPCDPRASPDHPTWWVVSPGTHHGQGGEKTAQCGP
jgi:hypothetical protein